MRTALQIVLRYTVDTSTSSYVALSLNHVTNIKYDVLKAIESGQYWSLYSPVARAGQIGPGGYRFRLLVFLIPALLMIWSEPIPRVSSSATRQSNVNRTPSVKTVGPPEQGNCWTVAQ